MSAENKGDTFDKKTVYETVIIAIYNYWAGGSQSKTLMWDLFWDYINKYVYTPDGEDIHRPEKGYYP